MRTNFGIIKAALAALANLEAVRAVVTDENISNYPEFATLMQTAGGGLDWESYEATSADGYITTMWRITGDNNVRNRDAPRGPVLLKHGIYSDGCGWMERSDASSAAFPIKLFNLGYDVWIANNRGTPASSGHTTLNYKTDPAYFQYCFQDEGVQDMTAQVDAIMMARKDESCAKVSIVTHSTAASMAVSGAIDNPVLADKVSRMVTLAPCYFLDLQVVEINLRDPQSQVYFFKLLADNNITTFFGDKFAEDVQATICQVPANDQICQYLLLLNADVANYGGNMSAMQFAHMIQLGVEERWQRFIPMPTLYPEIQKTSELFQVEGMVGPDVYAIFAGADERCGVPINSQLTNSILSHQTSTNVIGASHMGFLGANDNAFMGLIDPFLPMEKSMVEILQYCPQGTPDDVSSKKSSCKGSRRNGSHCSSRSRSGSSRKSRSKNSRSGSGSRSGSKSGSKRSRGTKVSRSGSKGTSKSRSGSKSGSNRSHSSKKNSKRSKKIKRTRYIGLRLDQNADLMDRINLNQFNVDFDGSADGYTSEDQHTVKDLEQLQGIYSTQGRDRGDDARAERRERRQRRRNSYAFGSSLPMATSHFAGDD